MDAAVGLVLFFAASRKGCAGKPAEKNGGSSAAKKGEDVEKAGTA